MNESVVCNCKQNCFLKDFVMLIKEEKVERKTISCVYN